jgi:hypothetical protein
MSSTAKSSFLTPLVVEFIDGRNWKVSEEFDYESFIEGIIIHIPVGFITDFASIPQIFWSLLPPTGLYGKAAVVHDFLYQSAGLVSKAIADRVLLEAMRVLGVNETTCEIIYNGVVLGGENTWNRDQLNSNLAILKILREHEEEIAKA